MRIEMNRRDEDGVSLSEDDRKELEWLRKYYRQSEARKKDKGIFSWALTKGTLLAFLFTWITRSFSLGTLVWRRSQTLGVFACIAVGILSSYYGPFADKKKEVDN